MTLCVVNAMEWERYDIVIVIGSPSSVSSLSLTTCNNSDWGVDHLQSLLSLSSAASGSMSTSEQDNTWYTHNTHMATQHTLNTHVNFGNAMSTFSKHDFQFSLFEFQFLQNAISIFWFSTFEFLIFNFFKTRFQFFMFQLFKNATSTFQFYNFIILIFEIYKSIFNFIK